MESIQVRRFKLGKIISRSKEECHKPEVQITELPLRDQAGQRHSKAVGA